MLILDNYLNLIMLSDIISSFVEIVQKYTPGLAYSTFFILVSQ